MFNSEKEMVDLFELMSESFLRRFFGKMTSRCFSLREFDSLNGVADIVMGTFRSRFSCRNARKPVNKNWIGPLGRLQYGAIVQVDTYAEEFGLSKHTALCQLEEYANANFLLPLGSNRYRIIKNYEPMIDRVVSVEAKLRDWKRALFQANRYKRFSDYVFVLLDDDYIDRALANLDQFQKANIGILGLDDMAEKVHIYYTPEFTEGKKTFYYNRLSESAYECVFNNLASR